MQSAEPAIQAHRLSVAISGNKILQNISFTIPVGAIVGLVGPSGSGKTTLIRVLLGLQKPSLGTASLLGQAVGSRSLHSDVGYVTQSPSVYADLTIMENLTYFATLLDGSKVSKTERQEQVRHTLASVELTRYAHQIVGTLSGGQRARVSLAVALLGKPQLLLLDEPTVGLDPLLRKNLWKLFRELADQGITILVSSHAMDEASKCDEILFLRNGKLLASGTPKAIRLRTGAFSMESAFVVLASSASSRTSSRPNSKKATSKVINL